ncbi:hypothetical protein ES708_31495 [subsurface metagenome]
MIDTRFNTPLLPTIWLPKSLYCRKLIRWIRDYQVHAFISQLLHGLAVLVINRVMVSFIKCFHHYTFQEK